MIDGGFRTRGIKRDLDNRFPLVSVVTVVYNGEKELENTLNSILNQTYKNIELILVDGNSKDSSLEIIKRYDDKIDYWVSESDNGVYDAMNKAVSLTTGKWISFMNVGDSFYSDTVLEEIFTKKEFDCDVIYGKTNQIFSFGSKILIPDCISKEISHLPFNHQSIFTSRSCFDNRGYDIKYRICADFDFYYDLIKKDNRFEFVDIIVANYDNSNGISSKFPIKKYSEELEILDVKNRKWKLFIFQFNITCRNVIKFFLSDKIVDLYRKRKYIQK